MLHARPRRSTKALAVTAGALALFAVPACSGADEQGSPATTTAAATALTTGTSPAAGGTTPTRNGASASSTSSAPAPSGPARCRSNQLGLSLTDLGAATGNEYYAVVFTNRGSAPCTLTGYPGVSLVDGSGAQLGASAQRDPGAGATVTVAPSAAASTVLHVSRAANYGPDQCGDRVPATAVKVYPPGETDALTAPVTLDACTAPTVVLLRVRPVEAGDSPRPD